MNLLPGPHPVHVTYHYYQTTFRHSRISHNPSYQTTSYLSKLTVRPSCLITALIWLHIPTDASDIVYQSTVQQVEFVRRVVARLPSIWWSSIVVQFDSPLYLQTAQVIYWFHNDLIIVTSFHPLPIHHSNATPMNTILHNNSVKINQLMKFNRIELVPIRSSESDWVSVWVCEFFDITEEWLPGIPGNTWTPRIANWKQQLIEKRASPSTIRSVVNPIFDNSSPSKLPILSFGKNCQDELHSEHYTLDFHSPNLHNRNPNLWRLPAHFPLWETVLHQLVKYAQCTTDYQLGAPYQTLTETWNLTTHQGCRWAQTVVLLSQSWPAEDSNHWGTQVSLRYE